MCYTAQEEMTRAIRDIAEGVKNNELLIRYVVNRAIVKMRCIVTIVSHTCICIYIFIYIYVVM